MPKTKLKPIEKKGGDDFGNLLRMFGAQKIVDSKSTKPIVDVDFQSTKVVDQQSTDKNVDFKSTKNIVDPDSTKIVDLKSTQKLPVDSKSTKPIVDVDFQSTKVVDQQSTDKNVDFKSTKNIVDPDSTKIVDLKSTHSINWIALQKTDFYLIGVWQVLFDIFGDEKISESIRPLAKRFSMDPAQFYRTLKKLEAAQMVSIESSKRSTQIQVIVPMEDRKNEHV